MMDEFVIEGDILKKYNGRRKHVKVPNNVKCIASFAFWGNNVLQEVVIPEGVTTICNGVFFNCERLKIVELPTTLKSIGQNAFSCCRLLDNIICPDGLIKICSCAFSDCESLRRIVIPDSVKIENGSFLGCSGLADDQGFVIIKDILMSYHGHSENISIPEHVRIISQSAFCHSNIRNVRISNGVVKIEDEAFLDCEKLESVIIDSDSTEISNYRTFTCCNHLADKNGFVVVGGILFDYYGAGGDIVIPDNVTKIGDLAFNRDKNILSVVISDKVVSIGDYAFSSQPLRKVLISKNTKISDTSFNCSEKVMEWR